VAVASTVENEVKGRFGEKQQQAEIITGIKQ
jgi:hypothetical protein